MVVHKFPPESLGGTEIHSESLARELAVRHEVTIFYRQYVNTTQEAAAIQSSTDLRLAPVRVQATARLSTLIGEFWYSFRNKAIERRFGALLEEVRPDIVHVQHVMGLSAELIPIAKKYGLPVVLTLHDYWYMCAKSQLIRPDEQVCEMVDTGPDCVLCAAARVGLSALRWVTPLATWPFFYRRRVMHRALQFVDRFIAPSQFLITKYIAHGLPRDKIVYIENGIRLPTALPNDMSRRNDRLCFAYLGAIAPQKGVHILIEAFNGLSPDSAELRIYGDLETFPDYVAKLRRDCRNPSVHFLGSVPHDRVLETIARADALIVPSLWFENSPLVIQEAAAVRVPVIASRNGALAEKVQEGKNGFLFTVGDPLALRAIIQSIVENPVQLEWVRAHIEPPKSIAETATQVEAVYWEALAVNRLEPAEPDSR